jgi:DNA-binding helix-hairpin-helix protein with protein kinase domain
MIAAQLFDHRGQRVPLGSRLGTGGEGEVFVLENRPGHVAKVYKTPRTIHQEAKLRAIVGAFREELNRVAAWPTATLHQRPGQGQRSLCRCSGEYL